MEQYYWSDKSRCSQEKSKRDEANAKQNDDIQTSKGLSVLSVFLSQTGKRKKAVVYKVESNEEEEKIRIL